MAYKMKGFSGFKQTGLSYGISEDVSKKMKDAEFNRERAEEMFISGQEITGKLGDKIATLGQTFQDAADKKELGGETVEYIDQGIDPDTGVTQYDRIGEYLDEPQGIFTPTPTKPASTGVLKPTP
jgi:hypothetical protein|tara:strand:- start:7 stop:381 length:375 start_codon:yes stop_codon:yes gene_type:complete